MFSHTELKGHKGPVTCLDGSRSNSSSERLLVSGSEDCTVRVWDSATNKAVKCIHRCFADVIESVALSVIDEHALFVASGNKVFSFDLRADGVLQTVPLSTVPSQSTLATATAAEHTPFAFEDINAMSVSPHQRVVAVSDDSGRVYFVPHDSAGMLASPSPVSQYSSLGRVHNNIVGSLSFNPNPKRPEFLSGGFDCIACVWDLERHRANKSIQFQCFEAVDSSNQVFNPPFVQCTGFVSDGKYAVCALGDGSLRISGSKDLATILQIGAHNGAVTAMSIFDDKIVSGGIDGQVHCWELQFSKSKGKTRASPLHDLQRVWTLNHHSKVNSIFSRNIELMGNETYVGDVSNVITHYTLRQ